MDPNFVSTLHDLLVETTAPDTTRIQQATAKLKTDYYSNPLCIPALYEIVTKSPDQNVRQLAAVELRKRVNDSQANLWSAVPQELRNSIKTSIPQVVSEDPIAKVRHSSARVVSAIAAIELPLGTWPELLPFVQQACSSPTATHREVGIFVLFTILETVVEGFQNQIQSFFKLFSNLLRDPESPEVRITTLRALGTLAHYIDVDDKTDIATFQAFIPEMIGVLSQCLDAGNEDGARHGFDVFETLLILETPLLTKNVPELVKFFAMVGAKRDLSDDVRIMALNSLNWTIKYKKSKIQSLQLAQPILTSIMPIGAEDEPDDVDEDSPSRMAIRIVDVLATSLPPSQVFPHLHALITEYMKSPDAGARKSAIMSLGVSVEGCSEYMRPHMHEIWPIIEAGFVDPDPRVRKAACAAVGLICEWLEDECIERHAVLMPSILNLINDPATQGPACTALDALLEILESVIDQYLGVIMERLAGLLETAPLHVKAVVTGAIGSAAHASKEKFLPYFAPTMNRLQPFLSLSAEGEEIELRGITMDAIGTFAEAVGKDVFRPFFADLMKQAFAAVATESARLRECSFLFFGVAARVFEEEFAPYLDPVVKALLESCKQLENGEENTFDGLSAADVFASGDSSATAIRIVDENNQPTDIEDLDVAKMLKVNSAIAVEKEIAADTLGTIFAATRTHFLPYVESSVVELVSLLNHYYEGIRKSAVSSVLEIIRTFYELSGPQEWVAGSAVTVPLHENVKHLINHSLPQLLDMFETEDDKGAAAQLCQGLAETVSKLGPGFLDGSLETVCEMAKSILEQKALCQQDPDQDEAEEALEDQAEFDSVLISAACDLVSSLASALGPDFAHLFATFYPLIAKYYKKKRSLSDRSTAVGCLGEIITGMKGGVTSFTEQLFTLIVRALSDEEAEVRSNAAFALGVLIENTDLDVSSQYIACLSSLQPFFTIPTDASTTHFNARDNAAGAVSRMVLKNSAALPLEQVLPVLFSSLPLRNDYLENRPVFRSIFHLFRTNPNLILQYTDQLLPAFAHVLDPNAPDQIGDEVRAELIGLLGALNAQDPAKIQAAGLGPFVSA